MTFSPWDLFRCGNTGLFIPECSSISFSDLTKQVFYLFIALKVFSPLRLPSPPWNHANRNILAGGCWLEFPHQVFEGRTLPLQPDGLWPTGGEQVPPLVLQVLIWGHVVSVPSGHRRPQEKFNRARVCVCVCVKMCEQQRRRRRVFDLGEILLHRISKRHRTRSRPHIMKI